MPALSLLHPITYTFTWTLTCNFCRSAYSTPTKLSVSSAALSFSLRLRLSSTPLQSSSLFGKCTHFVSVSLRLRFSHSLGIGLIKLGIERVSAFISSAFETLEDLEEDGGDYCFIDVFLGGVSLNGFKCCRMFLCYVFNDSFVLTFNVNKYRNSSCYCHFLWLFSLRLVLLLDFHDNKLIL